LKCQLLLKEPLVEIERAVVLVRLHLFTYFTSSPVESVSHWLFHNLHAFFGRKNVLLYLVKKLVLWIRYWSKLQSKHIQQLSKRLKHLIDNMHSAHYMHSAHCCVHAKNIPIFQYAVIK